MPRGRTRDEAAHRRILEATYELIGSGDASHAKVDDIAKAAGVAKQTIYRWWPSRTAVIFDALLDGTVQATPLAHTDDPRADFTTHLQGVIRVFNSPTGQLIREMLAASAHDPQTAEEFRQRFWAPRRSRSTARLQAAIEAGQVRGDIDVELTLDALYGPLWLRLTVGHVASTRRHAAALVDTVFDGIAA